jgi:hypothetical protein
MFVICHFYPHLPKNKLRHPFIPPVYLANWVSALREPSPSNPDIPQSTAEFDGWAAGTQQEGNELDLQQAQKYIHLASLTNPADWTPLMSHTITI